MRLQHLVATACAVTTAVTAGLLVPGTPAWAHNELRAATPADKARLSTAPRQVVLQFAERLDPKYTTIAVTAAGGGTVAAGRPQVAGTRATQPLVASLAGGAYTVSFRVVSVDGHPVQGSSTFSLTSAATAATASPGPAPASQPPATSPPPAAANARTTSGDEGAGGAGLIVVLGLLGLLVVAAIALVGWRRRMAGVPPR